MTTKIALSTKKERLLTLGTICGLVLLLITSVALLDLEVARFFKPLARCWDDFGKIYDPRLFKNHSSVGPIVCFLVYGDLRFIYRVAHCTGIKLSRSCQHHTASFPFNVYQRECSGSTGRSSPCVDLDRGG